MKGFKDSQKRFHPIKKYARKKQSETSLVGVKIRKARQNFIEKPKVINDSFDQKRIREDFEFGGIKVVDNKVRLFHRTSKDAKDLIEKTGIIIGKEDGVFFSTKKEGSQAEGYGDHIVELDVPLSIIMLDDQFDDEFHVRIPTTRPYARLDIKKFLVRN